MTARLLLAALILSTTPGAPSSRSITAQGGVIVVRGADSPGAQLDRNPQPSPEIEPTWIYTTPLHWKHAPRGIESSETFATVVVLYPEGQYLEIDGALIKNDKNPITWFSHGDGLLYRAGTWERTDDRVIRTHWGDVYWSTETVSKHHCEQTPQGPHCEFEEPHPGPITTDTCALEGHSPTHLAQRIHCHQIILQPSRLNLDLLELRRMADHAFSVTPGN